MRNKKDVGSKVIVRLLLLAALCFALLPREAMASVGDYDDDGISDTVEKTTGITLLGGKRFLPCTGGEDRHQCLDWQTADLFVILVRATGCPRTAPNCTAPNVPLGSCSPLFSNRRTNIPLPSGTSYENAAYDPWEMVESPPEQGGLGITIHEITASQVPSTRVIPGTAQKAVKLTESLNACGTDVLGYSSWGTPNTTGVAVLYTQRIINKINQECNAAPNACFDVLTNEIKPDLYYLYIQSLLVHELGHVVALTKLWTASYGGPHEVSGSGFIMEQKPIVKIISGSQPSVKWYISTTWSDLSKSDLKLK